MRPLRLDLAGFTVFREQTTVDFSNADFFALVGPTGSGKSSLLDAMCFALYGTVPRWDNVRSVANALAPSCPEARVRLVFESAGRRYVASRVVRRVGRAGTRVEQTHAGLERLPTGFDLTTFDTGLTELGEVLAGTPGEMEAAVVEAIGLPYEQFVTCVVLPQGDFARFLHAKGAQRQQILVNLLGLHVYERIRERAAQVQRDAEQRAAAISRMLDDTSGLDDATLRAAESRLDALRRLVAEVDATLPDLEVARAAETEARQALERLDAEVSRLRGVAPPPDVAALAAAVERSRTHAEREAAAVIEAEAAETALREELAAAPDPVALRRLLDAHTERGRLRTEVERFTEAVAVAEIELTAAREALVDAEAAVARAEADLERVQVDERAATLRTHLVAGEPCPVCRQPVTKVPGDGSPGKLVEARDAVAAARGHRDKTGAAVRELDRNTEQVRVRVHQLTARIAELDGHVAGHEQPDAVRATVASIDELATRLRRASTAVVEARKRHHAARADQDAAEVAVQTAWREFDRTRDELATLGPPPVDRNDVARAWGSLADWAADEAVRRTDRRGERTTAAERAAEAARRTSARLDALFTGKDLPAPAGTDHARSAAVAVERAEGELRRITERREQVADLRRQLDAEETQARVARALAGHLKANMFERWLLEEALDLLVTGASAILRELSGGQYDLVHDRGDFAVVDHHDADLRRGVRTLSGGETFQASLALALALSEQLAGMSTTAASLESIVLDEGFGTLDAGTLDTVAATLENLAARGDRVVGVVTHVPALAERIPVRFEVSKDARTARVERTGA